MRNLASLSLRGHQPSSAAAELICVAATYSLTSIFFFRGILFSPGILLGGDWAFPVSLAQMRTYAATGLYMWAHQATIFGDSQAYLTAYPLQIISLLAAILGIDGLMFTKLLLALLFTLAGFSTYSLCRFLDVSWFPSFVAGYFLITTPLFFNYAIMGWQFVLLAIALLPFAIISFLKSIETHRFSYAIVAGVLYSIAFMQSQALVWYPLALIVFAAPIVKSRSDFKYAVQSLCVVFLVLLAMHLSWLIPTFLAPPSVLTESAAQTDVPLGQRLSSLNLLRLWGSLFNYQFESSFPQGLSWMTFVPAAAWFLSLLLVRGRLVLSLSVLALVPLVLFRLDDVVNSIPFTILIRDVARFIVLSSLAYAILVALTLHTLWRARIGSTGMIRLISGGALVVAVLLNSYPLWSGELNASGQHGWDIRLRTLRVPDSYYDVERVLDRQPGSQARALYLPIGGFVESTSDQRFSGAFHEFNDLFASHSPIPGVIHVANRRWSGPARDFAWSIWGALKAAEYAQFVRLLDTAGVNYVVLRLDMKSGANIPPPEDLLRILEEQPSLHKVMQRDEIVLFENTTALPHVYAADAVFSEHRLGFRILTRAQAITLARTRLCDFSDTWCSASDQPTVTEVCRNTTLFKGTNQGNEDISIRCPLDCLLPSQECQAAGTGSVRLENAIGHLSLNSRMINPTRYEIHVSEAVEPYYMIFNESFDVGWKAYIAPLGNNREFFQWSALLTWLSDGRKRTELTDHLLINGFANGWNVTQTGSYEVVIEYLPQRLFELGLLISIGIIVAGVAFFFFRRRSLRQEAKAPSLESDIEAANLSEGTFWVGYRAIVVGGLLLVGFAAVTSAFGPADQAEQFAGWAYFAIVMAVGLTMLDQLAVWRRLPWQLARLGFLPLAIILLALASISLAILVLLALVNVALMTLVLLALRHSWAAGRRE